MYVTAKEIVRRYGRDHLQLPSDHNSDGLPDLDPINAAIVDASSEIDGYLSGRFAVPLTGIDTDPALSWVKRCCSDMAVYYLCASSDYATEIISERYRNCISKLKFIASGKGSIAGNVPTAKSSNRVSANTRELTRRKLDCLF